MNTKYTFTTNSAGWRTVIFKLCLVGVPSRAAQSQDLTISSQPVPQLANLDRLITNLMLPYQLPGGQLLRLIGAWDRDISFDPMFHFTIAAQAVDVSAPASCETVIRYMLGQRLDFTTGQCHAYSNFGYCVPDRIMEKVTGNGIERSGPWADNGAFGSSHTSKGRFVNQGNGQAGTQALPTVNSKFFPQ